MQAVLPMKDVVIPANVSPLEPKKIAVLWRTTAVAVSVNTKNVWNVEIQGIAKVIQS